MLKRSDKMKLTANKSLSAAKVGDNLRVPAAGMDRPRLEPFNTLCVVLSDEDEYFYKLCNRH
jgi:hypothetical protein